MNTKNTLMILAVFSASLSFAQEYYDWEGDNQYTNKIDPVEIEPVYVDVNSPSTFPEISNNSITVPVSQYGNTVASNQLVVSTVLEGNIVDSETIIIPEIKHGETIENYVIRVIAILRMPTIQNSEYKIASILSAILVDKSDIEVSTILQQPLLQKKLYDIYTMFNRGKLKWVAQQLKVAVAIGDKEREKELRDKMVELIKEWIQEEELENVPRDGTR